MQRKPHEIILKPLMTEKQIKAQEGSNCYYFRVAADAGKNEIKQAIENLFKVKVVRINTLISPSKIKRVGRNVGRLSPWKKASVTLREGDVISLFEGV